MGNHRQMEIKMTKSDKLINLSGYIYDQVMSICEDVMEDDNELEKIARKVQLYYEKIIEELF